MARIDGASGRQKTFDYLSLPEKERMPWQEFIKQAGITRGTYFLYKAKFTEQLKKIGGERQEAVEVFNVKQKTDLLHNSEKFLSSRSKDADEALMEAVRKGNAMAIKIYYQLTNRLVEKQESKVTHKLEPDDYFKIRNQAILDAKYRGATDVLGDRKMLPEPTVLPDELCVYTECGDTADSQVD